MYILSRPTDEGLLNLTNSSNDMHQTTLPSESLSHPGSQQTDAKGGPLVANSTSGQFHFFLRLPLEIQLKIWEFVCFIPRVVDVFSSGTGCEALHNMDDNFHDLFGGDLRVDFNATHCLPPSILHVCQASRRVGLQFYTLAFGKGPFSATPKTSSNICFSCQIHMPAHIYINWECDVVCPMGTESRDRKDMEVQILETEISSGKMLRYLAIDPLVMEVPVGSNLLDTMDFSNDEELSWVHLLVGCPKLEEIILYHLPDNYSMRGRPLELIDVSEVDIEQGVGFKILELKKVRDVILSLNGRVEMLRKGTEVRELSKVRKAWAPLAVKITAVRTGRK